MPLAAGTAFSPRAIDGARRPFDGVEIPGAPLPDATRAAKSERSDRRVSDPRDGMSWQLLLEFVVSIAYGVLSSLIPIFNSEIYIAASQVGGSPRRPQWRSAVPPD